MVIKFILLHKIFVRFNSSEILFASLISGFFLKLLQKTQ